jgi:hypothetical protein
MHRALAIDDIIGALVRSCDDIRSPIDTLRVYALLSKEFHRHANPRLWAHCDDLVGLALLMTPGTFVLESPKNLSVKRLVSGLLLVLRNI